LYFNQNIIHTFNELVLCVLERNEIDINDCSLVDRLTEIFNSSYPVALIQLPPVFGLVAPPSKIGIQALHYTKARLDGKLYGSLIGDYTNFLSLAVENSIPDLLKVESNIRFLDNSFLRIQITDKAFASPLVSQGTHQGLLLGDGPYRTAFKAVEQILSEKAEPSLFNDKFYSAPLCTSANISGDIRGSITDYERALEFMVDRNIPLMISGQKEAAASKGSYPIFSFHGNKVKIERKGPGMEQMIQSFPATISVEME
jgi:hypothetical protein